MPNTTISESSVVYQLTLRADPRIYYIGQCLESRWGGGYKGSGVELPFYYKRDGDNAFFRAVLRYCKSKKEAKLREKCLVVPSYIDKFSLNKTMGGGGLPEWTDEMRAKMTGREIRPETKEKLRVSQTGRKPSDETRAKMSASQLGNTNLLGHVHTKESRQKIALGQIGRKNTPETIAKRVASNAKTRQKQKYLPAGGNNE